jgi:hypothetical protein
MRHCGKWKAGDEASVIELAIPQFDVLDECEGITRYGRDYDQDRTRLIVVPGHTLKRSGQSTRSDIVWMWKHLLPNPDRDSSRIRIGDDGYLTILHTTEPELYITSMDVGIAESWAEAEWAWKWIEYVCKETVGAQKSGKLRLRLDNCNTYDARLISTLGMINGLAAD